MKKIYFLFSILFLLVFTGNISYALIPQTVTVSAPAVYCVGTPTISVTQLTGSFTQTGATCVITVYYQWYYNFGPSTSIATATAVGAVNTTSTTTAGTVTLPIGTGPIPTTLAPGLYYYFCRVYWSAVGAPCNITTDTLYSNSNLVQVGPPVIFPTTFLSPNPICGNDSVYFSPTVVGADSFSWTGPISSGYSVTSGSLPPPFFVTIADAGVYTLTAYNHCGAATLADTTVTDTLRVSQPITFAKAFITPDTICSGNKIFFYDSVVAGAGATSPVVYTWAGPGFLYATTLHTTTLGIAADSLVGHVSNTGQYFFTAVSGNCKSFKDSFWVQVDTLPYNVTASVSPNPLCANYPVTLLGTETAGTSFYWYDTTTHAYSSTLLAPPPYLATLHDTGIYAFIARNSCGADTAYTNYLVIHKAPAPITGSSTVVCLGNVLHFVDTTVGGHWFSSNPGVATINTVGTVTSVGPGTDTIYYSTTYDSSNCYDSVIIHVGAPPGIIGGIGDLPLCAGDSVQFTDPTPGGVWSSSNLGVATVDSNTGYVEGIAPVSATIFYTTPGCPPQSAPITIAPAPNPITGMLRVCLGAKTTLTETTTGGTWSVTNNNANIVPLAPDNGIATGLRIGIDTIIYTDGTSNKCSTRAVITVDSLPNISVVGQHYICKGDCTPLYPTAVQYATYMWLPPTGISCTDCDSVNACPLETQLYTITVTNGAGCVKKDTFLLSVKDLPGLKYEPIPFFLCRGTRKEIFATDSIVGDVTNYAWYPNVYIYNSADGFVSGDSISNPYFADTIDLVYVLHGINQWGCKDSIKVPVSVLDSAITTLTTDKIICLGDSVRLKATSTDPRTDYEWFSPDTSNHVHPTTLYAFDTIGRYLHTYTDPWPIAKPDVTTTYAVLITENACFSALRYTTVFIDPIPVLSITPPAPIVAGSSVTLTVTVTNGDTAAIWSWTPVETVSCPTCQSTAVTPTVTSTYSVCVTTNRGCYNCDSVVVHIFCDNSQIFIPNTFTPNGDGFNDRFIVSGKGLGLITHLTVFNRWGQIMYDVQNIPANDMTYGWDGTYKGQILEPDVFMYVLEVMCETDGVVFKFHGDISMVR